MKSFLLFVAISLFVARSEAEVWSQNGTDAQYPGMCVFDGEPYPPGTHKLFRQCVKIICGENGWISGHSCVPQKIEGCKPGELAGIKRPFPDCCKRFYHCHNEEYGDFDIESY